VPEPQTPHEFPLTGRGLPGYFRGRWCTIRPRTPLAALTLVSTLLLAVSCGGDNGGGMFAECGNGTVEGQEECDDGATLPCDGCSATCTDETGYVCGDGTLNQSCGEQCDDGNTTPGDVCDAVCALEGCGNGVLDTGEECDDGDTVDCDGCSASCTSEIGFVCGDGMLNQSCGEQCDDGNTTPGDGCNAVCALEVCGNGVLDTGEECDDGDTVDCDGCSASCTSEIGFVCGDGILNLSCGEQCDDGNNAPGDGCDAMCQIEQAPLIISGEYAVDIETTLDTCGFGSGSTSTPMNVQEVSATVVTVDIPVGGAGGECNERNFVRVGDTLTRQQSTMQQIGACKVQVSVTTTLTFFSGLTVMGSEINTFSEVSGDCSGLTLPCTVELDVTGATCNGCFDCIAPTAGTDTRGLGPLGSGLRSGLVIMSR